MANGKAQAQAVGNPRSADRTVRGWRGSAAAIRRSRSPGFSLIEILVVTVILAVTATAVTLAVSGASVETSAADVPAADTSASCERRGRRRECNCQTGSRYRSNSSHDHFLLMSREGNSATSLMFRFVPAFVYDSLSRERLRKNGPSAGSAEAVGSWRKPQSGRSFHRSRPHPTAPRCPVLLTIRFKVTGARTGRDGGNPPVFHRLAPYASRQLLIFRK